MPIPKEPKNETQPWKLNTIKANREGTLKTIFETNGDRYTGVWHCDKKEGKGTLVKKNGTVYDGDWQGGLRHGYGVRSVVRSGELTKEYSGGWVNDKKEGYGAQFYASGERYEGEWFDGKRSGWGRMSYNDGSVYDGEWLDGQKSGQGMLLLPDGNRYEGMWENDLKNGNGKYYYLDKGQVLAGMWVDGTAKCGEMSDLQRENASNPTQYPLPVLEMPTAGPDSIAEVLRQAKEEHLSRRRSPQFNAAPSITSTTDFSSIAN